MNAPAPTLESLHARLTALESAPAPAMPYPSDEPFLASKTMVLLLIGTGTIFALLILGVVVQVAFHQNVWQGIEGAMGIEGLKTGAGVVRNVQVDGAARSAYTAATIDPPKTGAF